MTDLNEEVRASLSNAGIGKRYHDMSLSNAGPLGTGMLRWLHTNGDTVRSGRSVVFHGEGLSEPIILLARALHVNGIGCKVTPLVRMRRVINDPQFREDIDDIDVLVILNAQDTVRCNPLHDSVAAEVEYLIRERHDNMKATILQIAVPEDQPPAGLANAYWTSEFWHLASENFESVTATDLKRLAGAKTK